jgi:hypothetical protein
MQQLSLLGARGSAFGQLFEALRYKLEGRVFDSRWCHWNFSLTESFRLHYGPGSDSVSQRNEHQKYFQGDKRGPCVGLTTLPPSCADCLEIWESQSPGTLRAFPGLYSDNFTFILLSLLLRNTVIEISFTSRDSKHQQTRRAWDVKRILATCFW